jgi:hypothetical protein
VPSVGSTYEQRQGLGKRKFVSSTVVQEAKIPQERNVELSQLLETIKKMNLSEGEMNFINGEVVKAKTDEEKIAFLKDAIYVIQHPDEEGVQ